MKSYKFTAIVTREGGLFVSECPELGIASQGPSLDDALDNLKEAIRLYFKDEEEAPLIACEHAPLLTTVEVQV